MTMTNQSSEQPVEPFVSVQRRVISDKRNGKLSYREYELYVWMRLQATPFGIAAVNVSGLLEDLRHFKSTDYINRVLKSLRSKKYIHYQPRQGRGGSFEVHFGDWKRPDKTIKQLDNYFAQDELRSSETSEAAPDTEVGKNQDATTPKLGEEKKEGFREESRPPNNAALRSSYNDTDTQNVNHQSESSKPFKRVATQLYTPKNDAEIRCKQIAMEVGDPYLNFILSVLNDSEYGGIEAIEEGFKQFSEAKQRYEDEGKPVKNPPALFNSCVTNVVEVNKHERG